MQSQDDTRLLRSANELISLRSRPGAGAGAQADPAPVAPECADLARAAREPAARLARCLDALPAARAAADFSDNGSLRQPGPNTRPCISRLPLDAAGLNAALNLPPGTLVEADIRNDHTGYRVALYRDDVSGRLMLVPRDTDPHSLVDWRTNILNGMGEDTPQYASIRGLAHKLVDLHRPFDLAGYSKGGGLAQEAGLIATQARVHVFNSAGLTPESLVRTGQASFDGLVSRTTAFATPGDLLSDMNEAVTPAQRLANARWLRQALGAGELPGPGHLPASPIAITTRSPDTPQPDDAGFLRERQALFARMDAEIERLQDAFTRGQAVAGLPPVRAPQVERVGRHDLTADLLGATHPGGSTGRLLQHRMSAMLTALDEQVTLDRAGLQAFLHHCG